MYKTKVNSTEGVCFKTWVEVSGSALKSNIKLFKTLISKDAQLMTVIKSNAYGHGLEEVASFCERAGVEWFGVDSLEEGIRLRRAGISTNILVLGFIRPICIKRAIENDLSFVAYDSGLIKALLGLSKKGFLKKHPAKVHLKVETGTTRQGLSGIDLLNFAKKISRISGVQVQGAYTHYANIEDTTDHTFAELQLERLKQAHQDLIKAGVKPQFIHSACTAAALLFPGTHLNLIRLGIGLYGLWPSKETQAVAQKMHLNIKLKPAMTWKTVIAQIKHIPKGTAVSYGLTERVMRPSKIAILPVGYWDGYDRKLSGSGYVLVRGIRCKIVGRICMNMCMADVTDVPGVKAEDQAVLLGSQKGETITAEELASKIGTINYEVVTRINPLTPRVITK